MASIIAIITLGGLRGSLRGLLAGISVRTPRGPVGTPGGGPVQPNFHVRASGAPREPKRSIPHPRQGPKGLPGCEMEDSLFSALSGIARLQSHPPRFVGRVVVPYLTRYTGSAGLAPGRGRSIWMVFRPQGPDKVAISTGFVRG